MKEEKIYFHRIFSIIEDIENYLWKKSFQDFCKDQVYLDASILKLQILGETIKKIEKYDDIPYKDIIWLRDWISHDYFGLDLEIIFDAISIDIPELKEKLKKIYREKYGKEYQ